MAHIKTYVRVKPTKRQFDDYDTTVDKLYMRVPELIREYGGVSGRPKGGVINHEFRFTQVFPNKTSQKELFDAAAKDIVDGKYI